MSLVLSVDSRTIQRDLAALQKMGVIVHEGNTSAGRWVPITKRLVLQGFDSWFVMRLLQIVGQ